LTKNGVRREESDKGGQELKKREARESREKDVGRGKEGRAGTGKRKRR